MNDATRSKIKYYATETDSLLDKFYLRVAALPAPWTLVVTVVIVLGLVATRWI